MSFLGSSVSFRIRRIAYVILRFLDVFFPRRRDKLVIFSYHSTTKDGWRFSIDPEMFRMQIESLLSVYQPISLVAAGEFLRGERVIDHPSFVLTFDDGYRDILDVREFLAEKKIRPTCFILSDSSRADLSELGTRREFLNIADIQELASSGWEVGCHSATHGDFWTMTPEKIFEETVGAKKKLEAELGVPVRYFAYPRGRYTEEAKRIVRNAGYELALSMDDGFLSIKTDLLAVPRVGVDRTHMLKEFGAIHTDAAILFRKMVKKIIGKFL
jgi:peptidoglycan/xylan/chitin deacetylase (PgdA/CDA1 family)